MAHKLLDLNFAQLSQSWLKSRNNIYSDALKKHYQRNLNELFQKLEAEDFANLSDSQIKERQKIIEFFFRSLTFLDSSTISSMPFEMVKCLEAALNEWANTEKFIIVTSLIKGAFGYSFDATLAFSTEYYQLIKALYSIEFEYKLIQINVPEYLAHDYLSNVVLYHELGHFIDRHFHISKIITEELFTDVDNGNIDKTIVDYYFPHLTSNLYSQQRGPRLKEIISLHIGEYFCDVFASQYIADSLSNYLEYMGDLRQFVPTHPLTQLRIQLVDNFVKQQKNDFINRMNSVTNKLTGGNLEKRYYEFESEDFYSLLPVEIKDEKSLHYIFVNGWKIWLGSWGKFQSENKMNFKLYRSEVYNIINSLIEKSIGNYIVKRNWDNFS